MKKNSSSKYFVAVLVLLLPVICGAQESFAQPGGRRPTPREVPLKILSLEIARFQKPIRLGPPKRATEYREALVLRAEVDKQTFDNLPPDIEPYLYIGEKEYRIFNIDRQDNRKELILTFHVLDWQQLADGGAIVLTTDQGGPKNNPERFDRRTALRFNKAMITDKRSVPR